jgi:hypothetical protein
MRLWVYDVDFEGKSVGPRYVQAVMPKTDSCVQIMESGGKEGLMLAYTWKKRQLGVW